jgi:hypothetical protein
LHMEGSLPPEIRDRVFYLEGNHMHSSIQKVLTPIISTSDSGKDIRLWTYQLPLVTVFSWMFKPAFPKFQIKEWLNEQDYFAFTVLHGWLSAGCLK